MSTQKPRFSAVFFITLTSLAMGVFVLGGGCPGVVAGLPFDVAGDPNAAAPAAPADTAPDTAGDPTDDGSALDDTDLPDADVADDDGLDDNGDQAAETYTLTVNVTGTGTVSPTGGQYDAGSALSLTATPGGGFRFDHWEGDATGAANPLAITLSKNMTVTAVFVAFGDVAPEFYAVYDRILDTDELGDPFNIHLAAMNKNGTKVFVVNGAGDGNDRKGWVLNDLAGSTRTPFDLPDGVGQIRFLAASADGSRAFMSSGYEDKIFKWEGGAVTTVDVSAAPSPGTLYTLKTNASGSQIFMKDDWDAYRVNADGTGPARIIDADLVPATSGTGYRVWDIAVDDAGRVAFLLLIRRPDSSWVVELFFWDNGTITQLTDDRTGYKAYLYICPQGNKIVYQDQAATQYVMIGSDGTGRTPVAAAGHNFGGIGLDQAGTRMVYDDSAARGGRLLDPPGGAALELMPATITLSMTDQICMTGDGTRIMFIYRYSSAPLKQSVYIGHLNDAAAVPSKPDITHIRFSPTSMSRTMPAGTQVALEFTAADPNGLADVVETAADEMVNGAYIGEGANSPASFSDDPHDNGVGVDAAPGDGRFTTGGKPGGKVGQYDEVTVRLGTRDASGTVVIADAVLPIVP